jgi:aryl-alcohol dehydrogenase-like predicted oxidoreductase
MLVDLAGFVSGAGRWSITSISAAFGSVLKPGHLWRLRPAATRFMLARGDSMTNRHLGTNGPAVFPIGLGCMGMSHMYGAADEAESIATIESAVEQGVTLIDTGDFYGMGDNEMLIRRALTGRRDKVLLSVKFGALRSPDGNWTGYDSRPAAVKNFCAYSLKRLGTDHIDIYRPARLDPAVPVEDTIGAIAGLIKAGYVRSIGLSEVGVDTIRRAHAVHPITDVQIEYAMVTRNVEKEILPVLRELGIGMTAYGVLSRGLLSGSAPQSKADIRSYLPRFTGDNFQRNRNVVDTLASLALQKGITPVQLALAWVLSRGNDIVPIPGARTRKQLDEALGALPVVLSPEDLARIDEVLSEQPIAGTRYDARQMKMLDSERSTEAPVNR